MFNFQPVGWTFSIRRDSLLRAAIVLACVHASIAFAQDGKEARKNEAKAPADHVIYQTSKAGAFFVEKALMDRYQDLVRRLDVLRGEINHAKIEPKDAKTEVERLAKKLSELRERLEAAKVYVGAVGSIPRPLTKDSRFRRRTSC